MLMYASKSWQMPLCFIVRSAFCVMLMTTTPVGANGWRLAETAGIPNRTFLSGSFRVRYENLNGRYRLGRSGSDEVLVLRTLLHGGIDLGNVRIGAEIEDSRQEMGDSGTPLSATLVNTAELLQAYFEWTVDDLSGFGTKGILKAGRQTMDLGNRRLLARNRYRNTLNAFTGVDWQMTLGTGIHARAFYVLPVVRTPGDSSSLDQNEVDIDEEDINFRFWGIQASMDNTAWGGAVELYLLGLDENDTDERPTRNREIYTGGFRFYRPRKAGQIDYQVESMIQWGQSRTSTSSITDLNRLAHFQHAENGYTFEHAWNPRLLAQFDYASGDDDPNDGKNNCFDTLFGARRFDFGPTSIYGAFARSNPISPGIRLQVKPVDTVSGFAGYRANWLASDHDAWTTATVVDASDLSGSFLGHQVEVRVRWNPTPGNLLLETGMAHLFQGEFGRNASDVVAEGDSTYYYIQSIFRFEPMLRNSISGSDIRILSAIS
jgi:hypothetical protein